MHPLLQQELLQCTENTRVTLTVKPSPASALHALRPSTVQGTLIVTLGISLNASGMFDHLGSSIRYHFNRNGDEMGKLFRDLSNDLYGSPPLLRISVGLVVTPSIRPLASLLRISSMSAVSRKISMINFRFFFFWVLFF